MDRLGLVLSIILIAGGACAVLLAWRSLAASEAAHGEFHALLLTSLAGMSLLASAQNTVDPVRRPRAPLDPAVRAVREPKCDASTRSSRG